MARIPRRGSPWPPRTITAQFCPSSTSARAGVTDTWKGRFRCRWVPCGYERDTPLRHGKTRCLAVFPTFCAVRCSLYLPSVLLLGPVDSTDGKAGARMNGRPEISAHESEVETAPYEAGEWAVNREMCATLRQECPTFLPKSRSCSWTRASSAVTGRQRSPGRRPRAESGRAVHDEVRQPPQRFDRGIGRHAVQLSSGPLRVLLGSLDGVADRVVAIQQRQQDVAAMVRAVFQQLRQFLTPFSSSNCIRRMIGSVGFCLAKSVPNDLPAVDSSPTRSRTSSAI